MDGIGLTSAVSANFDAAQDMAAKKTAAAKDFEALLIAQMLKTAREAGSEGWLGSGSGEASTALEFAEQQLATILARSGGLGLAEFVAKGLDQAPASQKE